MARGSRARRTAALRRALKRRNPAAAKRGKPLSAHNALRKQAKRLGVSGSGSSAKLRARIAAKRRLDKGRKQRGATSAKRPTAGSIRRKKAAGKRLGKRIGAAVRRGERQGAKAARTAGIAKRRTAVKAARKSTSLSMLKRQRTSLDSHSKRLTKRIDKLAARQNPGFDGKKILRGTGFVLGGLTLSNFATAIANKAMAESEAGTREKVAEYVAPALLAGAAYWAGQNKKVKWLDDKDAMAAIGGVVGAVALRNVDALKTGVAKIPGIGKLIEIIEDLPSKVGLDSAAGAGAYMRVEEEPDFGMGEYVYDGGMGRYVADPYQVPQFSLNGLGEYIQTGPIGIPAIEVEGDELAEEAGSMAGLGATDLRLESIVPEAGQKIIRALPPQAHRMAQANIGQILGESSQLPGTLLVGVTVAGRDMMLDAGPVRARDFGPGEIHQAENIEVSPQGIFSRSVFTPVIPGVHN